MNFKWIGPLALLAALVIGDQIRINRPGHKYRLTVEVETPDGVKSGSRHPGDHPGSRLQPQGPHQRLGRCHLRRSRRRQESGGAAGACRQHQLDLDAINYVALRAYTAAGGKRVNFNDMSKTDRHRAGEGRADPGAGELCRPGQSRDRPQLCRRTNRKPCWARDIACAASRPKSVPNGFWPIDFGGPLGDPVTRGIAARLPWLDQPDGGRRNGAAGGRIARVERSTPGRLLAQIGALEPLGANRRP